MRKSGFIYSGLLLICLHLAFISNSQSIDFLEKLGSLPDKAFTALSNKSAALKGKLDKATHKYLSKLLKQEQKLQKKFWKKDSTLAKQLFNGVQDKYASLKKLSSPLSKYNSVYSGYLDSLTTALKFLKDKNLSPAELQKTLSRFSALQDKLNQTENIKKFLGERKKLLRENLENSECSH